MNTYYLKANTEAELQNALIAAELCIEHEEESPTFYGNCGDFILDWIGEIFEPTGVILDEGLETERPEMASVGGYHCNIYSESDLPASLAALLVTPEPTTPARKLAGT